MSFPGAFSDLARRQVALVGLGLMGGSLASALHGQVAGLIAVDTDPRLPEVLAEADVVILATPAATILELLPGVARAMRPGALLMDLGSTKRRICEAMDALPDGTLAVGGHPMCGREANGLRAATPTLYTGARFVLCETAHTTPEARLQAEALTVLVGATPVWMDRARHDRLAAVISHLPHLINYALTKVVADVAAQDDEVYKLAGGGFRGATRLAMTSAPMVAHMLSTNPEEVRAVLRAFLAAVDEYERLLDDPAALEVALEPVVAVRREFARSYERRTDL